MLSKLFHLGVIIKTYFHLRFPSKGVLLNVLPTYNNFPPQNSFDTPPTLVMCRVQTQISGILSTRSITTQSFAAATLMSNFDLNYSDCEQDSGTTRSATIKLLLLLHDSFI